MKNMDDSIAHPQLRTTSFELPAWKTLISTSAAVILGLLFILAGTWKITDPYAAASRMSEMRVPASLSLACALLLGTFETFGGVLLFIPRFRRWGAWITGLLLIVFMVYIGVNYNALRGADCSCFPAINILGVKIDFKRAVGPEFFVGDAAMLLLAAIAGFWTRASQTLRTAAIIFGVISVFTLVSYGVTTARQTGAKAPDTITVDGQPFALQRGKVFLFFFDPECSHCYLAAKNMATFHWNNVKVIGIPTAMPQFAAGFLKDTGLQAGVSKDLELLKKTFPFTAGPFGVALEYGRAKEQFLNFDQVEPQAELKKLGYIQ